ncbi:transposase [Plakobranchus ocellatus]|uniref:Transposase n=1 Tax=Plakobranchus ocellatus TaxID=259542 RepID=A0AAV4AFQ9_9GAST|nr:transposase [Plakobranchus ocellatus]
MSGSASVIKKYTSIFTSQTRLTSLGEMMKAMIHSIRFALCLTMSGTCARLSIKKYTSIFTSQTRLTSLGKMMKAMIHSIRFALCLTMSGTCARLSIKKIHQYFHLADSAHQPGRNDEGYDPLYKVCPLLDHVRHICSPVYKPKQNMSVEGEFYSSSTSKTNPYHGDSRSGAWLKQSLVTC